MYPSTKHITHRQGHTYTYPNTQNTYTNTNTTTFTHTYKITHMFTQILIKHMHIYMYKLKHVYECTHLYVQTETCIWVHTSICNHGHTTLNPYSQLPCLCVGIHAQLVWLATKDNHIKIIFPRSSILWLCLSFRTHLTYFCDNIHLFEFIYVLREVYFICPFIYSQQHLLSLMGT
mgnify:CR=1 FL=1